MSDRHQLLDVMKTFDTAMLVTHLDDEANGRPMAIAAQDDDGDLWFITSSDSPKAYEVRDDDDALVTMQSRQAYAMVHGKVALVDDRARLEEMWNAGADLYFPDGPAADDAVLVRFIPARGQFWDLRGGKGLRMAVDAAKALWKGESVPTRDERHGSASL